MKQAILKIRRAKPEDYEALCGLFEMVDALHLDWYPELFKKPEGKARERSEIEGFMGAKDRVILVAQQAGELLGTASLVLSAYPDYPIIQKVKYVTIDNLVVAKSQQGKGVGQSLLQAAKDWALEQGISRLELNVYRKNKVAQQFYEKSGFEPIRTRLFLDLKKAQTIE